MMLSFRGWWLESKNYTNREQVPRNESPEIVEGAVLIRFDMIDTKKTQTQGFENRQITQVIEVETRVNIKPKDLIYTDKWLRVDQVETFVPEDKKAIVRLYPNRKGKVERKKVYLI